MAQKRMFNLSVVDTDEFLEMPISSRLLYYELGLRADDDGFVGNWKKILTFTGLKEDDLKILITKSFIIPFETGVIVIRHWRLNNYLQKDRYKPTIYQEELNQLGLDNNNVYNLYTECIHSIDKNSIDKNSIDKYRLDKNSIYDFVEENFGRVLSPVEIELISTWQDNELTRYAIKQTVLNRASSLKYTQTILNSYKAKGITSVLEAEQEDKKRNKKNNIKQSNDEPIPEWVDKEIDESLATKEEQQEMEDLLSEFK